MTRETITLTSETQWLDLRKDDITSTMTAALFGLSPYATEFEIYQAKKHGVEVEFQSNDRIEKGNRLEHAIAEEVALQEGLTDLKPFKDYVRVTGKRIGSSFDYEAIDKNGNPLLLEIKAVDYFQYKEKWTEDESPPWIEIQCQHELLCADRFDRVLIVACSGVYDYHCIYRDRDIAMGKAIEKRIAKFWHDVDNSIEPDINYERDVNVINAMFPDNTDDAEDRTGDVAFGELLASYDIAKMQEKEFAKQGDAIKSEIHHTLGTSSGAYTECYKITTGRTKDNAGRVITQDKVGELVGVRKGYRQCLLKDLQKVKGS